MTQVNKNTIQSKPGPAVDLSQAMPVATALKARLLGQSGRSRSAVNLQDPKDAPPLGKGRSSKPRKGAPQPSGDDGDEESSAKSSSLESDEGDYRESDSSDDDTPLSAPRGGSKAQKGKAAVAAQAVTTTDEDEVEPEEAIYGDTKFLTPQEYFEKFKASLNLALWKTLQQFPTSYQNEDSDPQKWARKRDKLPKQPPVDAVDTAPIPREEAIIARKSRKSLYLLPQELMLTVGLCKRMGFPL